MSVTAASETDPEITSEQARDLMSARDRMLARHKLIEGMIRNNELQLRNESARGGAEIERACVLRDSGIEGAGPEAVAALAELDRRLGTLDDEHERLVSEREWLNSSLLEFEADASVGRKHVGNA